MPDATVHHSPNTGFNTRGGAEKDGALVDPVPRRSRGARRVEARAFTAAVAAGSILLLAGCSMDSTEERRLGAEAAAEIERRVRVVDDAAATRALTTIGNAIVQAGGPVAYPYTFRIVRDSSVNAFALPGGFVYVHTGLLRNVRDVAELAGVLGHEVAHARLSHGARQARTQQGLSAAVTVVCLFTGLCDSGVSQVAINLGANALTAKFSRTDELQADSAGIVYTTRAGVDPRGMVRFFARLREESGHMPAYLEWVSTHPMEGTRIEQAERLIGPAGPQRTPAALATAFAVLRARYGEAGNR